jgi:hypothetical protein
MAPSHHTHSRGLWPVQVPQSCEDSLRSKADNSNMAWLLHKVGGGCKPRRGGGVKWRSSRHMGCSDIRSFKARSRPMQQ